MAEQSDKLQQFLDEEGHFWTMPALLEDLDRGEYLYLTPKMCADLAALLRQALPSASGAPTDDVIEILTLLCEQAENMTHMLYPEDAAAMGVPCTERARAYLSSLQSSTGASDPIAVVVDHADADFGDMRIKFIRSAIGTELPVGTDLYAAPQSAKGPINEAGESFEGEAELHERILLLEAALGNIIQYAHKTDFVLKEATEALRPIDRKAEPPLPMDWYADPRADE